PPDVAAALRPRLAVGIGGCAVVEQPAVRGPRPRPLGRDVALLPVRLLARRLVHLAGEDAAVDPAAAARRAVRLQLLVLAERLARLQVDAVDLGEHRLGARLLVLARSRVVPDEVLDRLVALLGRLIQLLADDPAEVVVEPELRAAVVLRVDRLEV